MKNNYTEQIINKIKKSGIEIITDKKKFQNLINSKNIQKMTMDWVSEKEIDYPRISTASDIIPLLNNYNKSPQEIFTVTSLDGSHKPISCKIVSVGTVNTALVHPREVFKEAIKDNAAAIIVSHNHPSGNINPSENDINTTQTLIDAGKILGIQVLDHIITAPNNNNYYSFLEHDMIQEMNKKGITYGFTYNNKIYLDEELVSPNVAIHEYTHLWDKYTQNTNQELWNKGLSIFKNTKYWNEVISDPNYQDIKNDENLILSEIHARISGDFTEKTLEKIEKLDGKQTKLDAIDWNTESWNYISKNLFKEIDFKNQSEITNLKNFLATPLKDLMNEKNLILNNKNQTQNVEKQSNQMEKTISVKLSQETIDFYRNTAQTRKEQETGILNIIFRKNKNTNELMAIFPDHKFTKKDYWEYVTEKEQNKALNPNQLKEKTIQIPENEIGKFRKKIEKELNLKANKIKLNVYSELDDIPYFKNQKIKELEKQVKTLEKNLTTYKEQTKETLKKNSSTKIINLSVSNNLTDEQINEIIKQAEKTATNMSNQNKQNTDDNQKQKSKGRK